MSAKSESDLKENTHIGGPTGVENFRGLEITLGMKALIAPEGSKDGVTFLCEVGGKSISQEVSLINFPYWEKRKKRIVSFVAIAKTGLEELLRMGTVGIIDAKVFVINGRREKPRGRKRFEIVLEEKH